MSVSIKVEGQDGFMDLMLFEDIPIPLKIFENNFVNNLQSMKAYKTKDDDVLLCTYPKSGTHWVSSLLHYVQRSEPIQSIPWPGPALLEFFNLERMSSMPSPRNLASHLHYDRQPQEHIDKNKSIVLVLRNPKDTAVSLYHHLQKSSLVGTTMSWNCFITCFMTGIVPFGSLFDYLDSWQSAIEENKDNNVLVVYYEDMKKDGVSQLRRIQSFLGCENSDSRLQEILSRCSLQNLKSDAASPAKDTPEKDVNARTVFYRKGEIGDWKNYFTVAQNEQFDRLIKERMRKSMFSFQYE